MAFRSNAGTPAATPQRGAAPAPQRQAAAPVQRGRAIRPNVPGGRLSGIRASGNRHPRPREGRYIFEVVKTHQKSRRGDWFFFDVKVIDAIQTGDSAPSAVGTIVTGMINTGGKAADVGPGQIKALLMACGGCHTDEQLNDLDPMWDELFDAMCTDPDAEAQRGENPLAGETFVCNVVDSGVAASDGTNFLNYYFEPDEEEAPF